MTDKSKTPRPKEEPKPPPKGDAPKPKNDYAPGTLPHAMTELCQQLFPGQSVASVSLDYDFSAKPVLLVTAELILTDQQGIAIVQDGNLQRVVRRGRLVLDDTPDQSDE